MTAAADSLDRLDMLRRRSVAQAECEVFFQEHSGLLYRVAGSYEADPERRRDLLQEIVLAIWQAAGRFESRSSFKTFAMRIAHNRGIAHCAREARAPELVDLSEHHGHGGEDPEAAARRSLGQEALLAAVRRLPVTQRRVIAMALEGMSYKEIAEVLDISVSNVGVRLNRAKAKLREILDE